MLSISTTTRLALLIGLVSVTSEVKAVERGVAWAVDNRWASAFTNTSITWYHHWQEPVVPQMASNIQYVPMNWGPKYTTLWQQQQASMNQSLPQYLLSYNEPDVVSQANMTVSQAVTSFLTDIQPWRERGVLVSSPQIVWNTTWLSQFMTGIRANGTDVDFMAVHYYGAWNDTATPKKYIQGIYKTYNKPIWITELGTTQKSNGTDVDNLDFMNEMLSWMSTQSYIQRVAWSGAWSIANPPDNYIAEEDGMFYPNATLREIGLEYAQITTNDLAASPTSTSSSSSSTSKSTSTTSSVKTTSTSTKPVTTSTTSSSSTVHSTTSSTHPVTTTSTVHSTSSTKTTTAAPTSTHHSTTSSSTKKTTSTSTKKTTSTSTHHHTTSTSTKHHTTTSSSTKHHTSTTSSKKAAATTSAAKCRVLVNKGNVVRKWVQEEQAEQM